MVHEGPQRPEEGVGFPGIGVIDGCKTACACWKWKLGPLEEQPIFKTTESSLQVQSVISCHEPHSPKEILP